MSVAVAVSAEATAAIAVAVAVAEPRARELLTSRQIADIAGRRVSTVRRWAREDPRFPRVEVDGVNPRRRRDAVEAYLASCRGIVVSAEVQGAVVGDLVDDALVNYTDIGRMMRIPTSLVRHYAYRDPAFPPAALDELRRRADVEEYVRRRSRRRGPAFGR